MMLRMPDGSYINVPDELSDDEKYFYIKGKLQPPTIGERVKGALGAGVAATIETAAGIRSHIPGHEAAAEDMMRAARGLRSVDYIRRVEMAPPESVAGRLAQGLVEFVPQMPLYAGGEKATLTAMEAIPKLSRVATALKAVPKGPAVKEIPKSAARAAIGGATVGSLGAPPGSTMGERLTRGGEEALAFAGATTVFGTLFRLMGAGGRAFLRSNRSFLEKLEAKRQAEILAKVQEAPRESRQAVLEDELKTEKAYSPWESLYRSDYEAKAEAESPWVELGRQRDEIREVRENPSFIQNSNVADVEAKLDKAAEETEVALRLAEASRNNRAAIARMKARVEANKKTLEEVKGGTTRDQEGEVGMGGTERVGETPGRPVQVTPAGEKAPRAGRDVQAHEEEMSLAERYDSAKDTKGFDEFDWFERNDIGERWEVHKQGYPIKDVLKMSDEEVLQKLLSKPLPTIPTPEDLLAWQTREAGIKESQMTRRRMGSTVKAENRPEDYKARKKLKDRVRKLEEERKADIAMINDIIKADKADPKRIDDAVAATVRRISREDNPELFAQLEKAYSPENLERMQNKASFDAWRRKGEPKDRPYNLTQVIQKEGESVEALAERERKSVYEGEEEMDVHRRRGVTLSFLGTGELDSWFKDFRDTLRVKMETSPLLKQPIRDINTLKDVTTFMQEGKYETPIPAAKIIEDVSGEKAKLYDMTEKRGQDMMKASEWVAPVMRQFENHPGANRAVFEFIMADQTSNWNQGIHFSNIRDAVAGLTHAERKMLKGVRERGEAAPQHVIAASNKLTSWFSTMKDRYKVYLGEMYKAHLTSDQFSAVQKVLEGGEVEATAKAAKMKPKLLESLVKKWKSIDEWGLDPETYVPHVERGTIKLMTRSDKGNFKTVAVALNKEHAIEKARELIESGERDLYMDTTIPESLKDLPEPMRPMQYYRVVSKLQKAIAEDLVELNKELKARQILRGVMEVKPTKKFSPFEKPRHDVLEGEEDIIPILYAYAHSMETKMQLDPVIIKIQDLVPRLPANMRNAMVNLVEDVKGRRWTSDQITEEMLRKAGIEAGGRPFSRFVSAAKMAEAWFKFAYRPVAMVVNAASSAGHLWTKVGTKYVAEGVKFMRSEEGKRLLDSVRQFLGTDQVTEMTRKTHGKLRLWHPLGMFQMPEKPMRELALCANYLLGKSKGLSEPAAIEFAIRGNWAQNFIYNTAALPRALRTPVGRLLGQFKPYLVQEVNFISQLRGPEIARYLAVMATLGGPMGYMATLKTLPILSMFPWWGEIEDYVNTKFPRLSRGVPGLLGMDISAPATFQFPTRWEDWAGPFFSDLVKIKKEVLDKMTAGEIVDFGEAGKKIAGQTIPIARYWSELVEQIIDKDGWVKDERGRRMYHIGESPLDAAAYTVKMTLGAKDLQRSVLQKHEALIKEQARARSHNKQTVTDEVLDAIEGGEMLTEDMVNSMVEFGINAGSLRRAAKFRLLDPQTRRYIMTEVAKRPELLAEWPQLE